MKIYHARSTPLVEHYRRQGAIILTVQVTAEMAANQIYEAACAAQR